MSGERQTATTLDGIRADHVARYDWACEFIDRSVVLDAACGTGYGSAILADAGALHVTAMDRSGEALESGWKHWNRRRLVWRLHDLETEIDSWGELWDLVVSFETIEHLKDPVPFLTGLVRCSRMLLASVPNESVIPKTPGRFPHHYRHYTREQFNDLLESCGWTVTEHLGQADAVGPVEPGIDGRTLIAVAVRA